MSTGLDRNSHRYFYHLRTAINKKMYKISLFLISCAVLFGLTDCTTSYDQRQTGDYNVQIGLKNIELIALLKGGSEEYVDYDYAYDYSEMTIKPHNGTTPKPLNVTKTPPPQNNVRTVIPLADNTTESAIPTDQRINGTDQSTTELNTTIEFNINATGSGINATSDMTTGIVNQTANMVTAESVDYSMHTSTKKPVILDSPTTLSMPDSTITGLSTPPVPVKSNCRRGFAQNNQGKCEYKGHGTSNALRRLIKLAQKIKIGRGYTGT